MLFKGGGLLVLALVMSACSGSAESEETTKEPAGEPAPAASASAPEDAIDAPREVADVVPALQLGKTHALSITPSAVVGLTGAGGDYADGIAVDASNNS